MLKIKFKWAFSHFPVRDRVVVCLQQRPTALFVVIDELNILFSHRFRLMTYAVRLVFLIILSFYLFHAASFLRKYSIVLDEIWRGIS